MATAVAAAPVGARREAPAPIVDVPIDDIDDVDDVNDVDGDGATGNEVDDDGDGATGDG